MKTNYHHIPGLDGLRALSLGLVLFGHSYFTIPGNAHEARESIHHYASLGVTTFFVISGYLITRLLRNEQENAGAIYLRGFYSRRVLRIFPAFYSYITVISALAGLGIITLSSPSILRAATFSLNYDYFFHPGKPAEAPFAFVTHFWTLALEEQFYLL